MSLPLSLPPALLAEADAAYWRAQVEACQTPRPTPTNMDEE